MTTYRLTPEPDEKITTVWTYNPVLKWTAWERDGDAWINADGHSCGWAGLLVIGPVQDINPEMVGLTKAIQEASGRDEEFAYKIAVLISDRGYHPLRASNVFVTDENGLLKPAPDEPAAEPC